ncbi:winged helix-turn-helix domain-containing protein [Arcobacter aquimarinus]|uniref:winged helix-turn-helix domain-containing protein n=1 Tax=Arcobacter aquimarinus TaxID=1315211 RepID=UPI003BB06FEC
MNEVLIKESLATKSLLFISDDSFFVEDIKRVLNDSNVTFFENNKFYLLNSEINNFDVIIFDNRSNNLKKFLDVYQLTKSYRFDTPIILIENEIDEDIELYKVLNIYTVLEKDVKKEFLFRIILICLNFLNTNKKIQFENGYYFDINSEELFQGKKIIKLTKIEKKLIKLLSLNPNSLVSYEDIASEVWKGKVFSIYSLRNVINHIREKTDETFIRNFSNRGYILNTI